MSHNNKKSLTRQIEEILSAKLAIGCSKHNDKQIEKDMHLSLGSITNKKIYSWSTFKAYMKHANYYIKYCKSKYPIKNVQDCHPYINEWLELRIKQNVSAYTIKLEASALAKLFSCSTKDFIQTESRRRTKITRSRGIKKMDKHFSISKNADLVEFCLSTGLRRGELSQLRGNSLVYINDKPYLHVIHGTKGGRERYSPIIHNPDLVIKLMKEAGNDKVFPHIHTKADIHGYRAQYATELYNLYAREIQTLSRNERYYCRGDLYGKVYDKTAMLYTSRALGHNRINVIASHYLR